MDLNRIYNMDCLLGMKEIPDKSIDMILCDLPYGIIASKWDKVIDTDLLFVQYNRIIKDNGAIVLTATQPFATDLINVNRKYFRYDLIWEKTLAVGFANCNRMPMRKHECILVFYKKLPTYNPQGLIAIEPKECQHYPSGKFKEDSCYDDKTLNKKYIKKYTNYPKSVVKFSNGNNKNVHSTQKPLGLFEWLIKTYSNEGETVLDNCMGSGTTAIACLKTNRNYIGFELDEHYYNVCLNRIEEYKNSSSK